MHAIRQHRFGGPEVLRWEAVPLGRPGPGQVRVATAVAGVHLVDTALRAGDAGGSPLPLPVLPATPGREVAGTVEAVGSGVDPAWRGRRVVAHLGAASGGYAERVVTDAERLHALPDALPLTHAVAMVGTGRTAVAVLERAALRAEDVVLVPAAAGGLGVLLVQAAVRVGATVVGLAGGVGKAEVVRRHAGVEVVDDLQDGWPEALRDVLGDREPTVLLDGVGGVVAHELTALLRWGGRVLVLGWSGAATVPAGVGAGPAGPGSPGDASSAARGLTRTMALGPLDLPRLETAALAAAAARELVPLVDDRFTLPEAAAAHAALEARGTTGKVVLRAV